MSSNLAGQTVVVIGGSSGIGYSVAKAALLERAAHVIIGSSSKDKVENALKRLKADVANASIEGKLEGNMVDAKDTDSVKAFFENLGEIDHLVWTSGDTLRFDGKGLVAGKDIFDVRFWGPATAVKAAKIRTGGSVTFTTGSALLKPYPGWSLAAAVSGATDGFTRGLAVDMAPIRVNSVCPGAVRTELFDSFPPEALQQFEALAKVLPVRHIAEPDEVAEAYVFLMKCKYITGQRITVDGGGLYV